MAIRPNYREYHKSVIRNLHAQKNYIRNLIGKKHWESDGEHKENILRTELKNHLPSSQTVATGFVATNGKSTGQIDILICSNNSFVLFRSGGFQIVTPDAVRAIIEVKTSLNGKIDISKAIRKMADNISFVRKLGNPNCWCGLFVYGNTTTDHQKVLSLIHHACKNERTRVINCVAMGSDLFIRFWDKSTDESQNLPHNNQVWHLYEIPKLAQSYFLSNVIAGVSNVSHHAQGFLFPLREGKIKHRTHYVTLAEGIVTAF